MLKFEDSDSDSELLEKIPPSPPSVGPFDSTESKEVVRGFDDSDLGLLRLPGLEFRSTIGGESEVLGFAAEAKCMLPDVELEAVDGAGVEV